MTETVAPPTIHPVEVVPIDSLKPHPQTVNWIRGEAPEPQESVVLLQTRGPVVLDVPRAEASRPVRGAVREVLPRMQRVGATSVDGEEDNPEPVPRATHQDPRAEQAVERSKRSALQIPTERGVSCSQSDNPRGGARSLRRVLCVLRRDRAALLDYRSRRGERLGTPAPDRTNGYVEMAA